MGTQGRLLKTTPRRCGRSLEETFPKLAETPWRFAPELQGEADSAQYNCIAWASGDQRRWWWPSKYSAPAAYWPPAAPCEETLAAFILAFAAVGYGPCEGPLPEQGHEKIAIYGIAGAPKQAARQLPDGTWTSKLGQFPLLIQHTLTA